MRNALNLLKLSPLKQASTTTLTTNDPTIVSEKSLSWFSKVEAFFACTVTCLMLLVPLSIGALNPTAEVAAALAALIAIVLVCLNFQKYSSKIPKPIKVTMLVFAIYFSIGGATYFIFPPAPDSLSNISTTLHFILFCPILMVMLKHPPKATWAWLAIIGGATLNGLHTIYFDSRGSINPILFGGISVILAFASLLSWENFKHNKLLLLLPMLGFLFGILASFNSLARGSWIAIPPLCILISYYIYIRTNDKKRLVFPFIALSIALIGTAALGWSKIESRTNLAVKEAQEYFNGGNYQTSVGYRLETYKGALLVLKENPIIGVGVGHRESAFEDLTNRGLLRDLSYIQNAHNQLLADAINKGWLGVLSFLLMMLFLLRLFYKNAHKSPFSAVGLTLIVGFGFIGLTNITFTHGTFNTFFVALVAIALAHEAKVSE